MCLFQTKQATEQKIVNIDKKFIYRLLRLRRIKTLGLDIRVRSRHVLTKNNAMKTQ